VPIQLVPVPGDVLALVRISGDRLVLDAPWGLRLASIAHIWPEPRAPGGWMRVAWPIDAVSRRFVAPVDLQVGHALEVTDAHGASGFGWVADADSRRFVLAPARDGQDAVISAGRALDLWRAAELVAIEEDWRSRMTTVRGHGEVV
jgi:hypothetical protein